jgi:tetratricopeptide (TPR) repeat protein
MPEPNDLDSYMRRGWAYHSRGLQQAAEADFRRALELDSESVDANYVLGLILKAQDRADESVEYFKKTVKLLEAGKIKDNARCEMLRRLSLGHINELKKGDWDLEREVWRRAS